MAQVADVTIDNGTGSAVRTDLNNVFAAIISNSSGSSEPSTMYAYMWWADTSNNVLKIRNSSNNGWVELLQLDGTLTLEDGSASTPALAFRDDLNTGLFSAENDSISIATAGSERFRFGSAGQIGIGGATYGSSGQVLTSQGASSAPTWAASSGTTINSNADNRVITGSGTSNTLNAESTLTFDAALLNITSTTQGLGTRFTNTGNEYTEARFDAARTGAGSALGILQGRWNNANNVCSIYLQTGDDTSNKDDGQISFLTAASGGSQAVRMVVKNDGDVSISDGNMIFASGHGIDFSATSNASSSESTTTMSNELFNDYEVGTWQPTWSAVHGTVTTFTTRGEYVKIGRTVHCMFSISANGSSLSNASELKIVGLPFSAEIPVANGPRGGGGVCFAGGGMNTDISQVIAGGTTLRIKLTDSSFLQTNSSGVSFSYNSAQISGMFSFMTAS
ncbi:hypothetical protein [Hyphomonas sp.]|uniref:hypothetical protein n=1 Tax=Hyphomonas sp. TaxID=87 RepID=UPI0025BEF44E|nr:hypothetical protein [Hyphomonas sp.]